MAKTNLKLFVVKKYIMATSAHDALKRERRFRPDDCWVDEDWRKEHKEVRQLQSCMGFTVEHDYYSSDDWAKKNKHENTTKRK